MSGRTGPRKSSAPGSSEMTNSHSARRWAVANSLATYGICLLVLLATLAWYDGFSAPPDSSTVPPHPDLSRTVTISILLGWLIIPLAISLGLTLFTPADRKLSLLIVGVL